MADTNTFPNFQDQPQGALPVRLVTSNGSAFYNAAGSSGGSSPYQGTPLGYQQITSLVSAASLTVPATATYALIMNEGSNVRWRDDGTAPTSTVGMLMYSGPAVIFSGDLNALKFIQASAGAILNVSYYE